MSWGFLVIISDIVVLSFFRGNMGRSVLNEMLKEIFNRMKLFIAKSKIYEINILFYAILNCFRLL